jgi:hypothetical protein
VKRILVLLSVVALMVVMLAMSVAPAFAARPSGFFVECDSGSVFILGEPSQTGGVFGQVNSSIAQDGSGRCERGPFRL